MKNKLHYCNNCKEPSVIRKVYIRKLDGFKNRVEFCINKGCGYKQELKFYIN